MKVAVSSYSFSGLFNGGTMTPLTCIAAAKEIGFEGIEFLEISAAEGLSAEKYAEKLKEECRRLDMPVVNYTVGADFLNGSRGDFDAEIERVKKQVDLAAVLGAKSMRHDATTGSKNGYRSFDSVLPILAKGCRQVTEYAEKKGIKTMVENHGFFCQDSERMEKLVNAVAHPNFGLLADMGNFLCADENPALAVSRVAPYVFFAHAKDMHIKDAMLPDPGGVFFRSRSGTYLRCGILGHGNVPVKHCLAALKKAGYDGYVSLEFEGIEPVLTALQIGCDNLKRYIAQI